MRLDGHLASINKTGGYQFLRSLIHDASKQNSFIGSIISIPHISNPPSIFGLNITISILAGKHTNAWLGGNDVSKEGVWTWSDGSKFEFKNWGKGEPNNYGG